MVDMPELKREMYVDIRNKLLQAGLARWQLLSCL
jgi:hypothetical protein